MGHGEKHRNTTSTSKNVITSTEPIAISGTPPEIVVERVTLYVVDNTRILGNAIVVKHSL